MARQKGDNVSGEISLINRDIYMIKWMYTYILI